MNLIAAQSSKGAVQFADVQISHDYNVEGAVTLGLRAEDLILDPEGPLAFEIELIEELGAHRLLHGKIGQESLIVLADKGTKITGNTVQLSVKPDAVSLFDIQTGERL